MNIKYCRKIQIKSISNTWQRTSDVIGHGYFQLVIYTCERTKNLENTLSEQKMLPRILKIGKSKMNLHYKEMLVNFFFI